MENIKLSKHYINDYESLLIVAGAGLGIDSGLPDYRGLEVYGIHGILQIIKYDL